MSEQEKQAAVPYFIHEGMMTRMDSAMDKIKDSNKKMHSALCVVCVTLAFVVIVFVAGYTINNHNWIRYAEQLQHMAEETDAGIYQQPDPGDHS